MEIPENLNPHYFLSRLKLFIADIQDDLDLRFPEVRKRWSFEMETQLPESELANYHNLIKRFRLARRVISVLDWPLLLEWGEKRNQAMVLAKISAYLGSKPSSSSENDTELQVRKTLERIYENAVEESLDVKIRFFELLRFRWNWTIERTLVSYLINRKAVLE